MKDRLRFWAFPVAVIVIVAAFVAFCVVGSARKALWFDELFTLYVALSGDPATIWARLREGMDNHPPLYYWLGHVSMAMFGQSAFACRLPAMLGVGLALVCVYRFVRRRTDRAHGLLATVLFMFSVALPFAFEARAYGVLLGGAALCLLLWQGLDPADPGRKTWLRAGALFVALSATLWTHYYAVLVLVPLGMGELARVVSRRRVHPPTALALGAAALNVVPLLLFVRGSNQGFSASFWAAPETPFEIVTAYERLFEHLLVPMGALAALVSMAVLLLGRDVGAAGDPPPRVPFADVVAALGFLACPVVMWLLAVTVTRAFYFRYALFTVLGACLLIPFALSRLARPRVAAAAVALLLLLLPVGLRRHLEGPTIATALRHTAFAAGQIARHDADALVDDGVDFLQSLHLTRPEARQRLFHPLDVAATLRFTGNDTTPRALTGLDRYHDVNVVELQEFLRARPRFLLLSRVSYKGSWIVSRLLEDSTLRLTLVAREGDLLSYLVTRVD